jgi:predicted permease
VFLDIEQEIMKHISDIPVMMLPLLLPVVLGYFFRKIRVFDEKENDTLRKFVIKVSVPFLIFKSLYNADIRSLGQFLPLACAYFLLAVLYTLSAYFIAPFISSSHPKQNAFAFSIIIGNYAFLGWGVVYIFYGEEALTRAVFFTTPFWPVFLLCGFWMVHRRSQEKKDVSGSFLPVLIKNASVPIITAVLGIMMNVLHVPVPAVFQKVIDQFAALTIPMILFTIGLSLKLRMPVTNLKVILTASLYRLIAGFGLGLAVVSLLHLVFAIDTLTWKIILIEAPMPAAALGVFFIQYIDIDKELMSGIIAFSTLISLITIPIWYYVVEQII